MPKFKITTDAGEGPESPENEEDLIEFLDLKAAIDDAQIALAEMARDKMPDGKAAHFSVGVEDEAGKQVYKAKLDFDADTEEIGQEAAEPVAPDVSSQLDEGPRE